MKVLLFIFPTIVFAAGSGGMSDLIAPAVNLTILICLLVYKLKKPVIAYFTKQSDDVSSIMKRAESKAKEAKELMDVHSKKMADSDSEIARLKKEAEQEVAEFKQSYEKDVAERVVRLKEDSALKIAAEKKSLSDSVNELLVNNVVAKAKGKIKADNSLTKESTDAILKGL